MSFSTGKWVAGFGHQHGFRLYQDSLDGPIIANFNCSGGVASGLEAQANLELCAAAPLMLEALECGRDVALLREVGHFSDEFHAIVKRWAKRIEEVVGDEYPMQERFPRWQGDALRMLSEKLRANALAKAGGAR